jgi:hypothetical protein
MNNHRQSLIVGNIFMNSHLCTIFSVSLTTVFLWFEKIAAAILWGRIGINSTVNSTQFQEFSCLGPDTQFPRKRFTQPYSREHTGDFFFSGFKTLYRPCQSISYFLSSLDIPVLLL